MKILNELIEILADHNAELDMCLIKAQILAHKLKNEEFKKWVNYELRGYPSDVNLPTYRIMNLVLFGDISNGYHRHFDYRLPLSNLSDQQINRLTIRKVDESVSSIKDWANMDNLSFSIPTEACAIFSDALNGYYVERIEAKASNGKDILTQIRSKLLEYCLTISNEFPDDIDLTDTIDKSVKEFSNEQFKIIVQDNANIHIGDTLSQVSNDMRINIDKIPSEDVQALVNAINKDKAVDEINEKSWGENTENWYIDMLRRAGTDSWDISKATAAAILATLIAKYAGF
ncbi:hypothetical protein [Psychrobacter sp. M13]|uniref:AbiTii domain-containing protein n=1 Tax=Psychrobacter sp. M13 TaxID=3067275 RepID=UPI00273BCB2D|nr:hypothetical protein [Psychrobacter sp. M13]WLP93974.1 hypothetical protein Q9G97_10325 [Psychrobacter sp. M13]